MLGKVEALGKAAVWRGNLPGHSSTHQGFGAPSAGQSSFCLKVDSCFRCTINYEERMKGADKWENIMHNYENIQVYGHVLRAYGLPGTEPGRGATKTNTACCLTEETDACSDKCEGVKSVVAQQGDEQRAVLDKFTGSRGRSIKRKDFTERYDP